MPAEPMMEQSGEEPVRIDLDEVRPAPVLDSAPIEPPADATVEPPVSPIRDQLEQDTAKPESSASQSSNSLEEVCP
jgi:hypothetical protein